MILPVNQIFSRCTINIFLSRINIKYMIKSKALVLPHDDLWFSRCDMSANLTHIYALCSQLRANPTGKNTQKLFTWLLRHKLNPLNGKHIVTATFEHHISERNLVQDEKYGNQIEIDFATNLRATFTDVSSSILNRTLIGLYFVKITNLSTC